MKRNIMQNPTTIECFAPLNNKSLKMSPKENLKIQRTEILKQKPFFTDEKISRNRFWQNITISAVPMSTNISTNYSANDCQLPIQNEFNFSFF